MSPPRVALLAGVAVAGFLFLAGAASAASPGWKVLAMTGPTNLPPRQSEVQRVTVEAEGGTFTLSQTSAQGEGTLGFATGLGNLTEGSAEVVLLTSEGTFTPGMVVTSANIPSGTTVISVSGSTLTLSNQATGSGFALISAASHEVTNLSTSSGAFHPGDSIDGANMPAGSTVTSVSATTLTLSTLPTGGGTVKLTGTETTAPLAYDASSPQLEAALDALPAFGPGTVSVVGGPGGRAESPWSVTFLGSFKEMNVSQLSGGPTGLQGSNANLEVRVVVPGGPGTGQIAVYPTNVGGLPSTGTLKVEVGPLPTQVVTSAAASGLGWTCPAAAGAHAVTCTSTASIPATTSGEPILIPVEVLEPTPLNDIVPVSITGGGGGSESYAMGLVVSSKLAAGGIQAFWAGAFDSEGRPSTKAGGHPASALTSFFLNTVRGGTGVVVPAGDVREAKVDLPAGFIGDPLVADRCPQVELVPPVFTQGSPLCGPEQKLGEFTPFLKSFGFAPAGFFHFGIFNDVPPKGSAAEFSTRIAAPSQALLGSVRSTDDFGVGIEAPNIAIVEKIYGSLTALAGGLASAHGRSFLTNPTDCTEQARQSPVVTISGRTWQPAEVFGEPFRGATEVLPAVTGCQALTSAWLGYGPEPAAEVPSFAFQPTTMQAASPTGATANIHVPQQGLTDPNRLATSDLKKTVVTLPPGLSVNPAAANGLQACTEAQVGYEGPGAMPNPTRFNASPVSCPDGSKLGTFQVKSPLLEEELGGTIYLAAQEENPFDSLLALYLVVESERYGLTLKLPGVVRPDPSSGQLTATFDNNPQLPFEDLTLHFRGGGPRSTLATPETCGHFETTGSLEPWSAEHGEALPITEAGFSTTGGCATSDATRPFAPSFEAGTTGTQAGAYSSLVIKVNRKDGEQELKSLDFTLPKGLTGRLAGIPYCPASAIAAAAAKSGKAEQAAPSCPAASQIGTVDTAAGVGSEPFHVGGNVYLAGPYKGAPLSSVVVTPAVAGPFDLGDVVIRAPLFVDPETAQITAKSDPIPTILKGIPLKLRSVAIDLDRPGFTLNPTSCEPMTASASIAGSSGGAASSSNRFQVGGCNKLKFKPRLQLSLKGSTKHAGHPALKAVLTYPKQGAYANVARAQVNLPHSEFIDQSNLDKTCTKPVLLAGNCPKKSIYGKAKAWTPLLDKPLEGPVYLVGGYGYKLPALVAELNGQIRVVLKGKVDSGPNKGIRNTFEAVPDAPVSRFVLEMKGGPKYSLLENSEDLCKKPQRAIARFTGQNGLVAQTKPLIANQCSQKKAGRGRKTVKKQQRKGHKAKSH